MCSPLLWKLHLLSVYISSIMICLIFCFIFQMETTITNNGPRYYVMAVTPTRLYSFTGIGSLDVSFNWLSPLVSDLSHSASGSVDYTMAHKNNKSVILLLLIFQATVGFENSPFTIKYIFCQPAPMHVFHSSLYIFCWEQRSFFGL